MRQNDKPEHTAEVVEVVEEFEAGVVFAVPVLFGSKAGVEGFPPFDLLEVVLVEGNVGTHRQHRHFLHVTHLQSFVHFAGSARRKVKRVDVQFLNFRLELAAKLGLVFRKQTLLLKGLKMYSSSKSIFLMFFMK